MSSITVKINPDVQPTGSDLAAVNAARRSFNTRSDWEYPFEDCDLSLRKLKEKDKRLIQFLARGMTADDFESFCDDVDAAITDIDRSDLKEKLWQWRNTPTHDTPFSHTFISFEVKAPIFVARQLVKHEYLIFSEFSRRYITDDIEFYEPDYWRKAAPNKKQGSLDEVVDLENTCSNKGPWSLEYEVHNGNLESLGVFRELLAEGVAPEQARMVLPQSVLTEWTWSGTLGAFAKMCQLRLHPEAQYEARLVAQQVYEYLKQYYPVSAKALVEGPDV
jgi:thymidylate synthase (FAD)